MNTYSQKEERLNVITHAIGIPGGIVGLILMLMKSSQIESYISSFVFGLSIITLYTASTCYHYSNTEEKRKKLRVFDHAAIFILIAGTYTPLTLITLKDSIGITLLLIVWSIAAGGIILKIFFTGKYKILSTLLYIGMGWLLIFVAKPLQNNLTWEGIEWIIIGGVSYTVGAILYSFKKIPFNHAIFHVFVLGGTFSHLVAIHSYVII